MPRTGSNGLGLKFHMYCSPPPTPPPPFPHPSQKMFRSFSCKTITGVEKSFLTGGAFDRRSALGTDDVLAHARHVTP